MTSTSTPKALGGLMSAYDISDTGLLSTAQRAVTVTSLPANAHGRIRLSAQRGC